MEYVRVDENFPDSAKVMSLPSRSRMAALGLWLVALCYCSRHETDGAFPAGLCDSKEQAKLAELLVESGLWHRKASGGFIVHDYLDFNRSKADIERIREMRREAGSRGGAARAKQVAKQTGSKSLPIDIDRDRDREVLPRARPVCFGDEDEERVSAKLAKWPEANEADTEAVIAAITDTCARGCSGLHSCWRQPLSDAVSRTKLLSRLPDHVRQRRQS